MPHTEPEMRVYKFVVLIVAVEVAYLVLAAMIKHH